jgi:hypothetical protein
MAARLPLARRCGSTPPPQERMRLLGARFLRLACREHPRFEVLREPIGTERARLPRVGLGGRARRSEGRENQGRSGMRAPGPNLQPLGSEHARRCQREPDARSRYNCLNCDQVVLRTDKMQDRRSADVKELTHP